MIHVDIPIRLKTELHAGKNAFIPTVGNMDLILIDGDDQTQYFVGGIGHNPDYLPPIPDTSADGDPDNSVPGYFHFTKSFDIPGKWQVFLVGGVSTAYEVHHTYFVQVQQSDIEINNTAYMDLF